MKLQLDQTEVGGLVFEWMRGLTQADTGGAQLGECLAAAHRIRDGDFSNWTAEFASLADRLQGQADSARKAGHRRTARGCYLRASNYYRMAAFYAAPGQMEHHHLFPASRTGVPRGHRMRAGG